MTGSTKQDRVTISGNAFSSHECKNDPLRRDDQYM